jgi:hypothetical protein
MFLSSTFNGDRTEITRIISDVIGEVDIKLDSGQTLADRLITNHELEAKIIEKSKKFKMINIFFFEQKFWNFLLLLLLFLHLF